MKKSILISLTIYILFSSALYAQTSSIKIQGNLESTFEGKNVRINTLKNGETHQYYSSIVKNGTFQLEINECASCDTLAKFLIGNNPDDEIILCLDNKNIRIYSENEKIRITGTELNDQYQQYRDSNNYYLKVLASTLTKMEGTATYVFDRRTEEYKLMRNWGKFKYHFIERNIHNSIGIFLFKNDLVNHFSVGFYKGDSAIINLYNFADERIKSDPFAIKWKEISESNIQERIQKEKSLNKKITDLNVLTPDGSSKKLLNIISKSNSKYFILEFWASWCGPCIAQIPALKEMYKNYQKKGLEIIAISIDEDASPWKNKLKQINTPWINLIFDKNKISIKELKKELNFSGVPHSILLDKSGKIISYPIIDIKPLKKELNNLLLN